MNNVIIDFIKQKKIKLGDKVETKEITEKANEFMKRVCTLTPEDYHKNLKEQKKVSQDIKDNLITSEEAKIKICSLMKELENSQVVLFNETDFKEFSIAIGMGFQVEHEIKHSLPYKEAGISSLFVWTKLNFDGSAMYKPGHAPYGEKYDSLKSEEKAILSYKSLKAVDDPSEWDIYSINLLEEIYSKDFFALN